MELVVFGVGIIIGLLLNPLKSTFSKSATKNENQPGLAEKNVSVPQDYYNDSGMREWLSKAQIIKKEKTFLDEETND